ncbi:glomulin-like [Asterias amurensis]|uniref:glomulin-like n=1 Tax=Asterias amurensis TaxID=7602 RepID=UPI003AB37E0A
MLTDSVEGFRGLSVQSLKSRHEDTFIVLSSVKECMDQGNSNQLKDIICDEEFKGLVEYIAWDLLPLVCPHLSEKEQNDEMYRNCIEIITRLAELGSPKEMFIGLLEQVNRFLDTVVDFLRPLQTVMRRLGLSKPLYYKQLLSTLYTHMEVLKVPSVSGMGVMERRLLSQDPDFSKVETTLVALLEFLTPIVWDVQQVFDKEEIERYTIKEITEIEGTRTEIMKFVLNLLEHPLVEMEFKYSDDADEDEKEEMKELEGMDEEARERLALRNEEHSISKTSAEQCMFFLDSMGCSFMSLLLYANQHALNLDTLEEQHLRKAKKKKQDDQDDGEEEEEEVKTLPVLGLGCFAYILLVEGYETNRMPSIYSAVYMLEMIMPYVEGMLRRPEESIIFKGLELLASLVKRLDDQSLDSSLIDTRQNLLLVPQCLVQIMVMCPSKSIRRKAVSILPSYIDCFNWKGRYHILRSLLLSSEHSGVRGMLIGKIKDYVHCSLQSESSNEWFGGCHIHKLFTIIFKLDEGIQSDLLHEADKHMGALNFLRYLFLRDTPDKNATGIWSRVDWLQTTYLQPLHTCLDMSKAHYDLKMKATQAEVQAVSEKKQMTVKLNVGGQDLPQMPPAEQYKVLQSAKYTFDLLASILGRIGEIISSGKR